MAAERELRVTAAEFRQMFEAVKTWGQWGADDQRGALNYITAEQVTSAATLIRCGVSVSLALPLNTKAGPDNPKPVHHYMTLLPDADIGSGDLRMACDYVGMEFHGDAHSHIDALPRRLREQAAQRDTGIPGPVHRHPGAVDRCGRRGHRRPRRAAGHRKGARRPLA
jgi:hypothetical protein